MEGMEVLVRGVMMQGTGGVSFRGLEWAWVAIVATIVIAFVSAKRVSIVSVGWTWGAKPGQVRVRVHSFSSMSDGSIVTASGMFSAEILNCSADSCSEDASSSSDGGSGVSDAAGKVAAEMVFIFEKKTPSATLLKQHTLASHGLLEKIPRRRTKSLDYQKKDSPLLFNFLPIESFVPVVKREGIEWDALPASLSSFHVDTLLPIWAQSLTQSLVYITPPLPSCIVTNTFFSREWDPLLKLRIRDSVLCDRCPVNEFRLPLAPVAVNGASIVTLKNDVVRFWDSDNQSLVKSVHMPKGYGSPVSAFDVDWESKVAVTGRNGGLVSVTNLESAIYEKSYQTQKPVVQAVSLDKSTLAKTVFTGGPVLANPGCSVSLWDSRSSCSELSVNLISASNIYGIHSQGNELYVRDAVGSLAAHDVRMFGSSSVNRVPCDVKYESAPEDRWWDMDTSLEVEEKDVEDEFWDCQTADEVKGAGGSYVGNFVMAMSRNFSSKSPSK